MTTLLLYFDGIMLLIAAAIYLNKIVRPAIADRDTISALINLGVTTLLVLYALWFFNAARGL